MIDIPPNGIDGLSFIPLPEKFYVFKGGIFWILSFFKIQNSMRCQTFLTSYSLRMFIGATMSCFTCLICVRCFYNIISADSLTVIEGFKCRRCFCVATMPRGSAWPPGRGPEGRLTLRSWTQAQAPTPSTDAG